MTNCSLKPEQFTLPIYVHPWYEELKKQESTTQCVSPSRLKLSEEPPGLKSIEWAAGLFEGEGWLTHVKNGRWQMGVKMTDLDVMQDFYDIVRLGFLNGPYHFPSMKKHHLPQYRWMAQAKDDVAAIIQEFYPYVGERRRAKFDEFIQDYYGN